MEIDIDIDWNRLDTERLERELQAQNDFMPASESRSSPLHMESIVDHVLQKESGINAVGVPGIKLGTKPHIPGKVFFPKEKNSCLTKTQQAIALRALQVHQQKHGEENLSSQERQDLQLYMSLQSQIQQEHKEFTNAARKSWGEGRSKSDNVKWCLQSYGSVLWKRKLWCSLNYPQFYNSLKTISLAYQEALPPVQVNFIENVASFGTVPKFSCPTLISKYILKLQSLPTQNNKETYNSKLPVSQDENISLLVEKYNIDIVISMSGLKKLMDDTGLKDNWDTPVVVKQHEVKGFPFTLVEEPHVEIVGAACDLISSNYITFG